MSADRKIRIMVVENDQTVRDICDRYFRMRGHEVLTSASASEALSVSNWEQLDAWFIDMALPGMGGFDLAIKVRRSNPHAGLFLMSGYPNNDLIERVKSLERAMYLS